MVLAQNKYKNSLVGVLGTQITLVSHSSPSCYVTLRTQVIRLKVEECNEPSCEALIFPHGVVLFNFFSTICI